MTRYHSFPDQVTSLASAVLVALICSTTGILPSGMADDRPTVSGADPLDIKEAGQRDIVLYFPWSFQLPQIARHRDLPQRMLNEPVLQDYEVRQKLADQVIETWIKCFKESDDSEIRIVAVEHLSRSARLNNADLSPVEDLLIKTLQQTTDRQLFWGCLCAIRDGDLQQAAGALLDLAKVADDDTLRIVDPLLASWAYEPAISVWQSRLQDSLRKEGSNGARTGPTAYSCLLACQALAEIGAQPSADSISSIVVDRTTTFQLRHAAAVALRQLAPDAARDLAGNDVSGSLTQRLLAVELLNQGHDDAIQAIMPYCDDQNSAVALAAWDAAQRHAPEKLLPKLADGLAHGESGIRQCCTRLVRQFPTEERIQATLPLLADRHIGVRNSCRAAMSAIATANEALEQPIVDLLAQQINNPKTTWQSIEQACYVLGVLKRPEFGEACLKLCGHEKPEVYVSAAWLYHLMPEPKLKKEFMDVLEERLNRMTSGDNPDERNDLDRQLGFLLQAGGYSQCNEVLDTMVKQLDKYSGLGEQGRSAGLWGIGALKAGSKDEPMSAKVITTMNDRMNPLVPEYDLVRRMAAQSVGRIGARSSVPILQAAFPLDSAETGVPQTIRWALQFMGEASPGDIIPVEEPIGGWRLQPITSSR